MTALKCRAGSKPALQAICYILRMRYKVAVLRIAGILIVLLGGFVAYTQNPPPARPFAAQKVKDDLYIITGGGGNVAAYITSEGVILVDDMYDRDYQGVMGQVRR